MVDLTVSRPVKILALVGLLVAVAGGGLMTLRKPHAPSAPVPTVAQLRARAHARTRTLHRTHVPAKPAVPTKKASAKPAVSKPTVAKPAVAKPALAKPAVAKPAVAKPTVAKAAPPAPKPAPKPKATVAANGLPMPLAEALKSHAIVVVSLFDPQSQTDSISYAEAKAGAADAGVGFLGVNLLDDAVASPLTAILPGGGLLPDPGVLVFSAPGTLVLRFDGFADRDAVAQAAAQALSGRTASTP